MVTSNSLELLPPEQELSLRRLPLGPGVVVGNQGAVLASCPLARLAVQMRCSGPVAAVQVVQAFSNSINETLELTYMFALPPTAAVSRFRAQVGQRLIEGQIFEKEAAKKQFGKPSRSAFLISMFEREHAPVFSVSLGLANPGENITIELAYAELLPAHLGEFQWRFPFLLTSKLLPGTSLENGAASEPGSVALARGIAAGPNLSLSVQLETAGMAPQKMSCSHPCAVHKLPSGDLGLELAKQGELQARDFVLAFRYGAERAPQTILRHTPRHFVLNVVPPFARPPATCPRDLVILVDVSDNATNAPRSQAIRHVASLLLGSLGPGERFALVGFNDDLTGYKHGDFRPLEEVEQAVEWLSQIKPRGRANMTVLLERIMAMVPEPSRGLGIVLVAGGHVGNEPELYSNMSQALTPPPFRFFTVGVDPGVNVAFLRRLASWTRGTYAFFCSDEPVEPIAEKLIEDTRFPLISDLHLVEQGLGLMPETCCPLSLPGLGGMQPVTVLGFKSGNGALEIRGRAFSGHPWGEVAQPLACQNPALGFVWAQQKVREMQDELKLVNGPRASRLRQIVMDLSQEYRLLNDFTAYALVEAQNGSASGGPGGSLLPSLVPYEWKEEMPAELPVGEGGRTRLYQGRIQLPPPPAENGEGVASEVVAEPAKVKPGLIPAGDQTVESAPGLKLKSQIVSDKPKRDQKPKLPSGPKIKETKPMFKKEAATENVKGGKKPLLPRPNTGEKPQMVMDQPPRSGHADSAAVTTGGAMKKMPDRPVLTTAQVANASAVAVAEEETEEVEAVSQTNHVAPPPVEPAPMVVSTPPPPPPTPTPTPTAPPVPPVPAGGSGEGAAPNHEQIARELLKSNAELRAALMADMRVLYQAIAKAAQTGPDQALLGFLEKILRRVQPVIEQSAMLKEVYRVGVLCYKAIQAKDPQALAKTQHWIQKFATLFQ